MTPEIKAQVSDTLEHIVLAFIRSWETPFYPDSALALFTQTEDFSLVIDGWYEDTYEDWAAGIVDNLNTAPARAAGQTRLEAYCAFCRQARCEYEGDDLGEC